MLAKNLAGFKVLTGIPPDLAPFGQLRAEGGMLWTLPSDQVLGCAWITCADGDIMRYPWVGSREK